MPAKILKIHQIQSKSSPFSKWVPQSYGGFLNLLRAICLSISTYNFPFSFYSTINSWNPSVAKVSNAPWLFTKM